EITRGRGVDSIGLVAGTTARLADATDIDLDNPVARGTVLLRAGRFPRVAGEALISPKLAAAFHVGVGDTLRLTAPPGTEHIVGIGVKGTDWTDGFIAVRGNELTRLQSALGSDRVPDFTFVRLPGHPSTSQLRSYSPAYSSAGSHSNGAAAVNWTIVAGAIALAIIGVVVSGAFAVGARRQLVTLGQLSANGADESLLRRSLSLQGAWCGVLGAVLGMAAGVTTLVLIHGRFNTWIAHDIGSYVWLPRDLVA